MLPANGRTSGCLSILSLAFTQTPRPPPQCHLGAYSVNIDEDLSMLRSQKPEVRIAPLQRARCNGFRLSGLLNSCGPQGRSFEAKSANELRRLLGPQNQESAFHDVSNDPGPHDAGPSRLQAMFEGYDLS